MTKKVNIIVVIVSLIVSGLLGVGVALLVSHLQKPAETPVVATITAEEVVSNFTAKVNNKFLPEYKLLIMGDEATDSVILSSEKLAKPLLVSSSKLASITGIETLTTASIEAATNEIKSYLESLEFTAQTDVKDVPTLVTRYRSGETTCQLNRVIRIDGEATLSLTLVCAYAGDYTSDIDTVNTLLGLWTDKSDATYTYIDKDIVKNDTYSVAIVSPIDSAKPTAQTTLVYVKEGDKWTYITDAAKGDPTLSTGKYILNKDLETAFKNPGYGAYLKEVLASKVAPKV